MHYFSGTRQPIPTAGLTITSAADLAAAIPRTGLCPGCDDRSCPGKTASPGYCLADIRPGGRRRKADVEGTEWLVLDIDYGAPPDELAEYERVCVRTHSGGWHVLVHLERAADAGEYEATIAPWLAKGADAAAKDICRFLYAPHAAASVTAHEGARLPVLAPRAASPAPRKPAPAARSAPSGTLVPWREESLRAVLTDPHATNDKASQLGAMLARAGLGRPEAEAKAQGLLEGQGPRHVPSAMSAYDKVASGMPWNGAARMAERYGLELLGDSEIEKAAPLWLRHNPHDTSRPWFVYRGGVWLAVAAAETYAELEQHCPRLLTAETPGKQVAARNALLNQHEKYVKAEADFDPDPYVLCAPNGLIDLRTGELLPHTPEAWCSRVTGCEYDNTRPTDSVEALVLAWCGGREDVAAHLWSIVGYTLTGLASERLLTWLHGPPGTAKSSFVDLLAAVMGSYAAQGVPAATWLDVPRKPADSIRATRGCRLVTSSELKGKAWDEDAILPFTGGEDAIRAEGKYKSQISWRQQCKLWVTSNTEPSGASAALQDRAHVIPFETTYAKNAVFKRTLPERYGPAFLARAVYAAVVYLRVGELGERPSAVQIATAEATEDDFGGWLSSLAAPGSVTKAGELTTAWQRAFPGVAPLNANAFGRKMRDYARLYRRVMRKDGTYYADLAL